MGTGDCDIWGGYTRRLQELFKHAQEIGRALLEPDGELEIPAPEKELVADFLSGKEFATDRFDELIRASESSENLRVALESVLTAYRDLLRERDEHAAGCKECQNQG